MQSRKKKQSRMPRILFTFIILLVLGTVGTAAFLVCRVQAVAVEGISRFTQEQIISISGIQTDDSMFMLNEAAVCSAIQKDPYVKSAKIERQFPDTVKITIVERVPAALVQYVDSFLKMDRDGYILEKTDDAAGESCPVITGMNVTAFQIGQPIKSQDPKQVDVYTSILSKLDGSTTAGDIAEINVANLENVYLLTRGNIRIRIGSISDLDRKFVWIQNVLPILIQQGKSGGTLDVTNPESASYIP